MTTHLQPLAWDSEFFAVPIARVTAPGLDDATAATVLDEARREGLRCLYFEADPDDLTTVLAAERAGFHLVDVRVVLEHLAGHHSQPLSKFSTTSPLLIEEAAQSDLPRLEEIAVGIGQFSRYTFDRDFQPGDSQRLYRTWINNALRGLSDVVLVARSASGGDAAVGLIACAVRDGIGHIQLAGVHPQHRQQGVGTLLVCAALDWVKSRGAQDTQVVTQARNVPAQRLYQQVGFFTKSMSLYYHRWLPPSI